MTGMSNYSADNFLNYICGQTPEAALPSVWMALMTAVDTDAGTGGTEVSGGAYARVQVAGSVAATAAFTTASPNITMTANPGWVVPGMNVYDTTVTPAPGVQIGTVSTYVGTALVLTANAAHASQGTTDNLVFSAFSAATGSAPSTITNGSAITFPQATLSWGTVIAFELRDAVTAGNLLLWDFLGNFPWLPVYVTSASPGLITTHAHGYANGDPVIFTTEYMGTAPTFSQSNFTPASGSALIVANSLTDTFSVTNGGTAVNTSATGGGAVRKIVQQSIPSGVTASFAAAALVASGA